MGERCTVEGTVQSVIFQNEENGYTVLSLLTELGEVVTVVGCIPYAAPGEGMTITGVWVTHPLYGPQITCEQAERRLPRDEAEMVCYLASGILKGVGQATAERMVDAFGADTLRVLEEEPERLSRIKGITAKKAMELSQAFRELTGLRRTMEFMARYDLPVHLAVQAHRIYGVQALEKLREDPYLLTRQQFGVDFSVADEMALSMGFDGDSACRTQAALVYELEYNQGNGHVFLPREKLIYAAAQLIGVEAEQVEICLDAMEEKGAVCQEQVAGVLACYTPELYGAECFVADKLLSMLAFPYEKRGNVDKIIREMEMTQGIHYAPLQREAVTLAAQSGVLLLTGGPGTGKTTATRAIVRLFEQMGLDILLLAPTGRAAKRMGELCEREAQTIHRCLGMSYNDLTGQVTFKKGQSDPLEAEAVLVDEMSMVDLPLMQAMLSALRPGCRLVMIGDADQLPSVGAGNVFGDLIRSGRIPMVALTEVFRQADESYIIRNAHLVNGGVGPDLKTNRGDFFFLCRRVPERMVSTVVELCKTRLPEKMGIAPEDIQVLTPTHKGECGTVYLNRCLQAALNPPGPGKNEKAFGDLIFREGDRVMQTKNNYDVLWEKDDGTVGTGIFNGDVGTVEEIDPSGELITLRFDDRTVSYTADLLHQLDMAYAITVHKAQGSEYKAVILLAAPAAPGLLVRGVLYTAMTRARELLIIVGDDTIPGQMAENDRRARRYSGLRRRLKFGGTGE